MTSSEPDNPNVQINTVVRKSFRDHLNREAEKQRRSVAELTRYALEEAYPYNEQSVEEFVHEQTRQT
jgi:hypothetical protein